MSSDGFSSEAAELRQSGRVASGLTTSQQLAYDQDTLDPLNGLLIAKMRFMLEGPLDADVLARVVDELLSRHSILGSRFAEVDGKMQQFIPSGRHELTLERVSFEGVPEEAQPAKWKQVFDTYGKAFDLSTGPLMRAVLVKLGADKHVLLLVLHHIAFDRGSVTGLVSELKEGYRALSADEEWAEPPLQYIDLAAYLEVVQASAAGKKQRAYWDEKLGGAKPLELPVDHSRAALDARRDAHPRGIAVSSVAEVSGVVGPPLHGEVAKLAGQERASSYIVLLAALSATLYRARQQDFLTYQTTYSLRGKPGTDNLIGYVGNPILVRVEAAGTPSYRDLIVRTRNAVLGAWSNGDVPITDGVPHGVRRMNFNYVPGVESSFDKEVFAPGISITQLRTPIDLGSIKIPWDLHLWLYDAPDRTMLRFVYVPELFEAATAQRLLAQFLEVLADMVKHPDNKL